jgi:hypothetical protein
MNMEDGRLIARFQRLTTELLIEKRLGRRRPELTDELYQTWLEVDQRGLKETPEYRNIMKRADRDALWLAGLVMLSKPYRPFSSLGRPTQVARRRLRPSSAAVATSREGHRSTRFGAVPTYRLAIGASPTEAASGGQPL